MNDCVTINVLDFLRAHQWPVGVAVSTTDSDSVDGGSIPSRAFLPALKELSAFLFL